MGDLVDTIRRVEALLREGTEVLRTGGGTTLTASQCSALLDERDALLAERDEALELLVKAEQRIPSLELTQLRAQRQQAIDALREIASKTAEPPTSFGVRELSQVHHIARAALTKLGEQS